MVKVKSCQPFYLRKRDTTNDDWLYTFCENLPGFSSFSSALFKLKESYPDLYWDVDDNEDHFSVKVWKNKEDAKRDESGWIPESESLKVAIIFRPTCKGHEPSVYAASRSTVYCDD